MLRLPCRRHGIHRGRKTFIDRYVTPQREPEWLVYARQPENVYFSHITHTKQRQLEMRTMPRQSGNQQQRCRHTSRIASAAIRAIYRGHAGRPRHDYGRLRGLPSQIAFGTQLSGLPQMSQPQMKRSRRDIFKFAGGAVAERSVHAGPVAPDHGYRTVERKTGLAFRGWRAARSAPSLPTCSLCPAGCAVRARCVGEQPVSPGRRAGRTAGPFRPDRASPAFTTRHASNRDPIEEATRAVAQRAADGIAILDLNPGRTASWTYRRAMASPEGHLPRAGIAGRGIRSLRRKNRC